MKTVSQDLIDAFLAQVEKSRARAEAERLSYREEVVKPWDHKRDGHRWECIRAGHGVETMECIECGLVKTFEV